MALVTELNDIRLQIKQGKLATVAMEVRSDRVIVLLLFHVYARGRAGTPLVAAIMRIIDGTVQAEEQSKLGMSVLIRHKTRAGVGGGLTAQPPARTNNAAAAAAAARVHPPVHGTHTLTARARLHHHARICAAIHVITAR